MGMTESKKAYAVSALRQCAREHEKDVTYTFNIRVSDLCNDIADYVEELQKENKELEKQLDSYKALESHYEEIEEDAEAIAKENEQLKKEISVLLSCSNCSENKGGYVCEKEYNDKCLAQKIEYINELKEEIEELKAQNKDLCESLDIMNNRESELLEQIEKMKRCFNCSKWFSNTELCVSNERGTNICDKWELAE